MATRTNNDVMLSHDDAERAARFLYEYADWQADRSRKSRAQPAIVALMRRDAETARQLSERIMRHLYTWSD